MTDNVSRLPQLNSVGDIAMGNGLDNSSDSYLHKNHESTHTTDSSNQNGVITPIHAQSHSHEDPNIEDSITPQTLESLYEEQRQELRKLKSQQKEQQLTAAQSNGAIAPHPVYNTRIRHGFDVEFESEQYMKLLAEV